MITSTQKIQVDDILNMFDEHGNPLMSDITRTDMENTVACITVVETEGRGGRKESDLELQMNLKISTSEEAL